MIFCRWSFVRVCGDSAAFSISSWENSSHGVNAARGWRMTLDGCVEGMSCGPLVCMEQSGLQAGSSHLHLLVLGTRVLLLHFSLRIKWRCRLLHLCFLRWSDGGLGGGLLSLCAATFVFFFHEVGSEWGCSFFLSPSRPPFSLSASLILVIIFATPCDSSSVIFPSFTFCST